MALYFFNKRTDSFDYEATHICKCCGTTFKGRFCNRCGEKVTEPDEHSILNFLESLLNAFTSLDGKFIKSMKLLVTSPGRLSRNIAEGVRVPYMKMVSLFLVANFFYFLIPSWDSFNSSLYTQMNVLGHHEDATKIVNQRLVKENIPLSEFAKKYEAKSTNLSKLLLIVLAIMFAFILMIINFSKKIFFFEHLLFSMEFFSFHLLINLLIITYTIFAVIKGADTLGLNWRFLITDEYFSSIAKVTLGYFLVRGQVIFYNQKWYWGALRALALFLLFSQSVEVYRVLLFYATMWLM